MDWDRLRAWLGARKLDDDTFEGLTLAAHAYAAAVAVAEEGRPLHAPARVARAGSLEAAIRRVRAAEGPAEGHAALLAVLLACEADLSPPDRRAGMPATTPLDPSSGLTGVVHHAWRGAGLWRAHRARRHEGVGPGPTSYAMRPEDQLDHLWLAWSRGEPLRYAPLRAPRLSSRRVVTELGSRLEAGALRVALCPLAGCAGPRFRIVEGGARFRACAEHVPVDGERLEGIVRAAAEEQVAILLLPELHVRPDELAALGEEGAVLTVGGSFHVEDGGVRNRAPVLVDRGHRLWSHDKRGYFRVRRKDVVRPGGPFEPAAHVDAEVCEAIVGGARLTVLDTSLGRLAVLVCADALDPDGYVQAVQDARPDFVLVVSMSTETDDFEAVAGRWERLGISTLYVNAGPAKALRAFCWAAVAATRAGAPTRVRWREGRVEAWRPGGEWDASADGVAVLHPTLGLLVDLAAMGRDDKPRGPIPE